MPCKSSLPDLHGIPILLKDNIAAEDKLNTTAGSFALLGSVVPRDAGVVTKLRNSGAIILGKASLNEWSSFRSTKAPNGWSARGGFGKNPYVLSADPCGSSSGSAIAAAANLVTLTLATEANGSILCPASSNSVVGIKPTIGLVSKDQVVPITPRQFTVGPICRTVADAVYVLDAIVGIDENDPDTKYWSKYIPPEGYKRHLRLNGLKKKRLRIVRNPYFSLINDSFVTQAFEKHFQTLRKCLRSSVKTLCWTTLENLARLSRDGFEKLMKDNDLDALVTPGSKVYHVLAIGGYPGINVPAGYDNEGVPFGINFAGLKGSEPKLIEIAYGFEQATKIRKPPSFKTLKLPYVSKSQAESSF